MNVVWLDVEREVRRAEQGDPAYEKRIAQMHKLELLDEMMDFQDERTRVGHLTPRMMIRGRILFKTLEARAETRALQVLARSYHRHLKLELEEYLKSQKVRERG